MQKKHRRNPLALLLSAALIAAMPVITVGCSEEADSSSAAVTSEQQSSYEVKGEGENQFIFTVVDTEGKETGFEIHTDQTVVGDALVDLGLISGDEGDYGLYVKTVNGITLDYDKDGKYWAFYVNNEYATSGVDTTDIEENATYTFKAE